MLCYVIFKRDNNTWIFHAFGIPPLENQDPRIVNKIVKRRKICFPFVT